MTPGLMGSKTLVECSFLRSAQGKGRPKGVAGLIEIATGDKHARRPPGG